MEALLNFTNGIDVKLLDQVVAVLQQSAHAERANADAILRQLKENEQAWQFVDKILEESSSPHTKYFALQILDDAINTRWKVLPAEQRVGIKEFVVKKVIELSTDDTKYAQESLFVNRLNLSLVNILKQEWPHNWPNFVQDLVVSGSQSESLCENNMRILKLLSEEVFDFSKEQMTTQKVKAMKEKLNNDFKQIFNLCDMVLQNSTRQSLVTITLQTLLRFLSWIPLGYVFETQLVDLLLVRFFPAGLFRNDALNCLTEIGSLEIPAQYVEKYTPVVQRIIDTFMDQLVNRLLPPDVNIPQAYASAGSSDCAFIHYLSLFLTGVVKQHLSLLEQPANHAQHRQILQYLVKISQVEDPEIFKICLECWNTLTRDLYQTECRAFESSVLNTRANGGGMFGGAAGGAQNGQRKMLYDAVLTQVRTVLISRMAKPEEVLVVEDDAGEIIRERTKDTDAIAQYKMMRETLVYLTHLNFNNTEDIMLEKLAAQCDPHGGQFNWTGLNTLCWAIGSISGAMNQDDERRFLVAVIKSLLQLCEQKSGKDNKAVVASNIMYVVGQYPRFLRAHWKFLRTVVNKLFEFMHERHPGVQDMACDTFLKIAQKCRPMFVAFQEGEPTPFIDVLLRNLPLTVSDLEPHQVETFYEACGFMISAQKDPVQRKVLIEHLMEQPNQRWAMIMSAASSNIEMLREPERIRDCLQILKINTRVCHALGHPFVSQLGHIYMDILNVYRTFSEYISSQIAQGLMQTSHQIVKSMRSVKKETLHLIEVFVSKSEDPGMVSRDLVQHLYDPVLGDYKRNIPLARDPEVLSLFTVVFTKLGDSMTPNVPVVFDAVFDATLGMINRDFTEFPEIRTNFYQLLKSFIFNCFPAVFTFNAETVQKVMNAIQWGVRHTERNISETSLDIVYQMLQSVEQNPDFAQAFYQAHLMSLLQDILYVLTDRSHKSGFKSHATVIKHIFTIVESGKVKLPLFDPATVAATSNQAYIREYVTTILTNAFPHIGKTVAQTFVAGLCVPGTDLNAFKQLLRDFLVQLKEFSGEDNAELYAEEKAEQVKAEHDRRAAVPGLLNPHEQDDMADL